MAIIKNLRMRGFKSFAKTELIEFSHGYNTIIGPNGSGKSNIMDALCFVLGKLGAKSMRAEKSSNLIFNGGKKGSPLAEAEVSIVFSNTENEFKIGGDEVKISRIIKKKGTSVYKINDEVRTRQQIIELLSLAKIDPDGYNVVLQGDIVRFMEMRQDERKQLIEDISGISVYEDRKNKALNDLSKVDDKLKETSIILHERDAYLRELKKDRDQALKYKELESNIKSNKATHLNMQIKERQEKEQEVEKKIQNHKDALKKIEEKITEHKKKINEKKEGLENISKDIEQKGEKDAIELQKNIEEIRTDYVRLEERYNTIKNELSKVEERRKQLQTSKIDVEKTIAGLQTSEQEIGKNIQELRIKEEKAATALKELKQKHGIGGAIEEAEQDIEKKETELARLHQQNEDVMRRKFELDAKIASIDEKVHTISSLTKEMDIKEVLKACTRVEQNLKKGLDEHSLLASQRARIQEELAKKEGELFKERARQSNIKEAASYDMAIKKILGLNNKKVYGTINQLGKVDKKYATALEVAAGARIKSIVVEDEKTAEDCIKILKQTRAGVATFLPLTKIRPSSQSRINSNGVIGPALDLISFDKKFKNAFSYVFGSTLIVENITVARRIGVGRCRMVTLDGDLVEFSGAMIGGHRVKRQGLTFQEKQSKQGIEKLETVVNNLTKRKEILDKRKDEIENAIDTLRKQKSELESEKIKIESTLGTTDLSQLHQDLKTLKNDPIYKEYTKLGTGITFIQGDLAKLREQKQIARKKAGIQEKGRELDILDSRKQKLREQIVQSQTDLKNIKLQIENIYEPEKEKIIQIIKQHNKENEEFLKEQQILERKLKDLKKVLTNKEKQEHQFQKDYKDLFTKRNKLHEEIQKAEAGVVIEDSRIKDVQEKINIASISRAKVTAEIEGLEKEFEEFKGTKLRTHISTEKLKQEIKDFEQMLSKIGNVNLRALEVYENIVKEYDILVEKVDKLNNEKDDVMHMIGEIDKRKKDMFMKTFNNINKNFTRIFSSLSTKGESALVIEDKENPLDGGVDIKVRITGNKFMDIKSMSGGEKTMAALALIFAIQEYHPASFYLLDEVDAALDKENSDLLSKLLAKYSDSAQYVLISHNDTVISEADHIYGVTMQEEGISKVISLKI